MQFTDGARILLADNSQIGRLKRVIIDPKSLEVTDIVAVRLDLTGDEKVIPVSLIESSSDGEIRLKELPGGWDHLVSYIENNYLLVNQKDLFLPAGLLNHSAPILFIYPPVIPTTGPIYPLPESLDPFATLKRPEAVQKEEILPVFPGDLELVPGSRVISQDGVELGNVERIITRSEDGKAVFFVLKRGLLVRERKLVPCNWVDEARGKEVRLGVRARFLDWLPDEDETI